MEAELLQAVRDHLRTTLGYSAAQCEIENDEIAPAAVGDLYVVVMPNGWRPGPLNSVGGGVIDEIYSVAVSVICRVPKTPKDRQRGVFLDGIHGINTRLRQIRAAIHFNYAINTIANNLNPAVLAGQTSGLTEVLKFEGVDPKPREVSGEIFEARLGEKRAGMARTAYFGGARWIQTITSMT